MTTVTHWEQKSKCLSNPILFEETAFGANERVSGQANREKISKAKRVCITCPVRQQCLDAAMTEEAYLGGLERHGIRGGLTAKDRILKANEDPKCARCRTSPVVKTDIIPKIRRLCTACQASTQNDVAARYFPPDARSPQNFFQLS